MNMKQNLFIKLSPTQFFFKKKSSSKKQNKVNKEKSSVDSDKIISLFPDILSGNRFICHAMEQLSLVDKFCTMAIQLDINKKHKANTKINARNDLFKIVDLVYKKENGICGYLKNNVIGCFFIDADELSIRRIAEKIKNIFVDLSFKTITIGYALYPHINFKKCQIIENACKALVHAFFIESGSVIAFDAVSLHISGDQLYQNGKIDKAIDEFKTALLLEPLNENIYNSLGVCYGILRDFINAGKNFSKAMELKPKEIMAVYNIGVVKLFTTETEKAFDCFFKAYKIKKDVFEVVFQIGKLYLEKEELQKGKFFLEQAEKINPESRHIYRYLGNCYLLLNMTDQAVMAYKKAVKLNPNDADSLSALGYLFGIKGEKPEIASLLCRQSIEISPGNGFFRHRLGYLYYKYNNIDKASEEFQNAINLGYDSSEYVKIIQKAMNSEGTE